LRWGIMGPVAPARIYFLLSHTFALLLVRLAFIF